METKEIPQMNNPVALVHRIRMFDKNGYAIGWKYYDGLGEPPTTQFDKDEKNFIEMFRVRYSMIGKAPTGNVLMLNATDILNILKDHYSLRNVKVFTTKSAKAWLSTQKPVTVKVTQRDDDFYLSCFDVSRWLHWVDPELTEPFRYAYRHEMKTMEDSMNKRGVPVELLNIVNAVPNEWRRNSHLGGGYQTNASSSPIVINKRIMNSILQAADTSVPKLLSKASESEVRTLNRSIQHKDGRAWYDSSWLSAFAKYYRECDSTKYYNKLREALHEKPKVKPANREDF